MKISKDPCLFGFPLSAFRFLLFKSCWLLTFGLWKKKRIVNHHYFLFLVFCVSMISRGAFAQSEIPLGTWRLHLSYNTIKNVSLGIDEVYGATESGVLLFNRRDNSLTTLNTLNGLSSTGISTIAFDSFNEQLLVAYEDGNFDIIKHNTVTNFNRLKNSITISGSKKINHISVQNNLAYLSTDYGVVLFDLKQLELKETWRDLGAGGKTLKIFQSTFLGDSIFIATEKGVLAGNLHSNLLDFNNWKRYDTGTFASTIPSIVTFNNVVYAAIKNQGLFHHQAGQFVKESFLQNAAVTSLTASSSHLLITEGSNAWRLNTGGQLTQITSSQITAPLAAIEDEQQRVWIGDTRNGLLSWSGAEAVSYLPNGPTTSSVFRLAFKNGSLYALAGGFTEAGEPSGNSGILNSFTQGEWSSTTKSVGDLTDIDFINNETYVASFGGGLEKTDAAGSSMLFDQTNSPLENVSPSQKSVYVTALESSANGLWVANFGATQPLHIWKNNSWQSFSFAIVQARYPLDLATDPLGNVWMQLDPSHGGGLLVFNPEKNTTHYQTELAGNGGLPTRAVHAIATDREGYVWVGTDQGVAYFFSPSSDAVKPIFENRFLLRDEKITVIEIDGGNRKWIGTERGVWLFGPTGETLIGNFTAENSPLLSNTIRDIEINDETGEVFFATDKGIVSYRSDATASEGFQQVKIFPNPVTSSFSGTVGITGLAMDAIVKITDISGNLVWQTQANGGTASWNVRDNNGRRVSTGIYLVFAATIDGSESAVGKIAVIE
jgi:ligand-binding sensor domain-containing protein